MPNHYFDENDGLFYCKCIHPILIPDIDEDIIDDLRRRLIIVSPLIGTNYFLNEQLLKWVVRDIRYERLISTEETPCIGEQFFAMAKGWA